MLTLGLAGDTMIGRLVNDYLAVSHPQAIWGNVLPLLKNTDINLINLEAALTKHTRKVSKVFNFKSDPQHVDALVQGSIHVVNIANNHILDYETEGLLETISTLDQKGILHVGAGKNLAEARKAAILTKNEITIGILGCTDNEPTWEAESTTPGTFYLEIGDIKAIQNEIRNLRSQVDIVIISIHWGPNMREEPPRSFRTFAHQLVDCGADIIHGHSAHIFQGVEVYQNRLILYDTGDFVDDYAIDPFLRNDKSFFFQVEISKIGPQKLRMIPTIISNYQVHLARGKEASESIQRMILLSRELNCTLHEVGGELILEI